MNRVCCRMVLHRCAMISFCPYQHSQTHLWVTQTHLWVTENNFVLISLDNFANLTNWNLYPLIGGQLTWAQFFMSVSLFGAQLDSFDVARRLRQAPSSQTLVSQALAHYRGPLPFYVGDVVFPDEFEQIAAAYAWQTTLSKWLHLKELFTHRERLMYAAPFR